MKLLIITLLILPFSSLFAQYLDNISPNEAANGETLNVTISGTNTNFSQATNTAIRFYFTASTTTATIPNSFSVLNSGEIQANITVPAGTNDGWYDYSVANEIDGYMLTPASFKVRGTVGITTFNKDSSYKVYPNPFYNSLSIEVEKDKSGSANLRLVSITGKVIQSKSVNLVSGKNKFEMNNLNLESGIYFVQMSYSNGKRFSTKIVKH